MRLNGLVQQVPVLVQFLMYPVTDAAEKRPSCKHDAAGHILTRDTMRHFRRAYTSDPGNARVSPLRNPSPGHSAPAFLAIARYDVLRDEGLAYGERLKAAGIEVTSIEVPAALHGFASLRGLAEAKRSNWDRSGWHQTWLETHVANQKMWVGCQ